MQNWTLREKQKQISRKEKFTSENWSVEFISGSIKRNNGRKWSTRSGSTNIAQRRVKRKRKIEENFTCASNNHNYLHVVTRLCQNRPIIVIKRKEKKKERRRQRADDRIRSRNSERRGWELVGKRRDIDPRTCEIQREIQRETIDKRIRIFCWTNGPINASEWNAKSYRIRI